MSGIGVFKGTFEEPSLAEKRGKGEASQVLLGACWGLCQG